MPLLLVRNDITKMSVDAIVNAANRSLLGGGGVDGCIHRAAGPELLEECRGLHGCETGEAKITRGYRLKASYVIHTVGPVYRDGKHWERELLASCYRNSLRLAEKYGCESVAFPLISSGAYRYPKAEALQVAVDTIRDWLNESARDLTVYLVFFDQKSFQLSDDISRPVNDYIDEHYLYGRKHEADRLASRLEMSSFLSAKEEGHRQEAAKLLEEMPLAAFAPSGHSMAKKAKAKTDAIEQFLASTEKNSIPEPLFDFDASENDRPAAPAGQKPVPNVWEETTGSFEAIDIPAPSAFPVEFQLDESFQEMLLRLIDRSGMTDAECYKRANIDRRLFSRIRSNPHYQPKKHTVFAFAVALRLSLDETEELLEKAGFALSHSFLLDVIVESFIVRGDYSIHNINVVLFEHDQILLGSA
ncbi:MAG: O-acetyl-ADP-ribose deacetylase [Oscillospiraceae bacterium]|nr:O-acetyl-ADP-ribose deacetylase [Oscillospiraceae bacterium]